MEFEIIPPIIMGGEGDVTFLANHEISLHKLNYSHVYDQQGYTVGSTRFEKEKNEQGQIVIRMYINLIPKKT